MNAIFNHLWQSTAFAGIAWLLTLALRKNHARVRHGIWLAASLKFLIPISILISLGSHIHWQTVPTPVSSGFTTVLETVSQPFTPAVAPTPQPTRNPLPALFSTVWLCGFLGIAFSWCIRWRRIQAAVRHGSPLHFGIPIKAISSSTLIEPDVFGIFRPILLMPEGISDRLTPAQLKAVIAHELCHARHKDNLIAAIHMFVETVFWFHPLVWWIGKRMVEERELACDEEVLQALNEPRAYAEGILNVCKLYAESPLVCVSGITGPNLRKRIEAIMTNRARLRLTFPKKIALATAAVAAVALPIVIGLLTAHRTQAQTPQPTPKFEVASIKPSVPSDGCSIIEPLPGGGIHIDCVPLKTILNWAYQVQLYQVSGGPAWVTSENWTIVAKPGSSSASDGSPAVYEEMTDPQRKQFMDVVRQRVQALLADRFRLALHRANAEQTIYALTVDKNGPKMTASSDQSRSDFLRRGKGQMTGVSTRMATLASFLATELARPVVNRTGLTSHYDFKLEWSSKSQTLASGPTIFTAIQEQLGLRLEAQKGPVEVLMIDHVEKPSEN